jgi:DNA-binding HxlR family transcriptional regulator
LYFASELSIINAMKKVNTEKRSFCPVNFALEEFGDIWSLLIVRDILFFDKKTYGDFLSSREKISTNILASRLSQLLEKRILSKRADKSDKRKDIYQLTQKGLDLYPVMLQMILWSAKYDPQTPVSKGYARFMKSKDEITVKAKIKEFYAKYSESPTLPGGH